MGHGRAPHYLILIFENYIGDQENVIENRTEAITISSFRPRRKMPNEQGSEARSQDPVIFEIVVPID